MTRFLVPARLAAHAAERGDWLAALPELVAAFAARWALMVGPPFEPGGECSWVAPATSPTYGDVVLKVGWTHDEARDEAAALRVWDGRGAVRVLNEHRAGDTTALLLERAPGPSLDTRPGPERDVVVTGLLRRLWVVPPTPNPFRPLADMCDAWAESAAESTHPRFRDLDPGLRREGLALFRGLPRHDVPAVLLATDLHAGNVLAAAREPWLAIDPKPYVGDPAYDVLQHLLNDPVRLAADPRGFVAWIAGLAGLDAGRVGAWLVARCVVEAAWWPHDVVAVARALRV